MEEIHALKSQAYDLIAQIEAYGRALKQLQDQLAQVNKKIQEVSSLVDTTSQK